MIRCIIIDDEPLAVKLLESYVERIPFLTCVKSCCCAAEAVEAINNGDVDAMFVDINMPDINGIELVRSLESMPLIVFTTAYSEYAIEGFKLDAVDYLLKPIGFEDFLKSANKLYEFFCIRKGNRNAVVVSDAEEVQHDCLFVKSDYRVLRVPINSIKYIESMSEYVRIYVEGNSKPIISLLSMKKIEENLPSSSFMRVHRSYLVNLNKIKEVSRMRIVYENDVYVPIGEMYKDNFFNYIEKHFVGKNS